MMELILKPRDVDDLSSVVTTLLSEQNAPMHCLSERLVLNEDTCRPLEYSSGGEELNWSITKSLKTLKWVLSDRGDRKPWRLVVSSLASSPSSYRVAMEVLLQQLLLDYPGQREEVFQPNRSFWYDLKMNRKQPLPIEHPSNAWLRCIVVNNIYGGMDKLRIGQFKDVFNEYEMSNFVLVVNGPNPLHTVIDELGVFPDGAVALQLGI